MIIDRKQIEGLEPVAEGYKIFNNDWTANYGNNYCYADENGKVEGTVHKQEGFPDKCKNGLHFCENPLDCFKFYSFVQWNKFAKVNGYGNISRDNNDTKVAVEILEIVRVLSFDEFIEEIKTYSKIHNGSGISDGSGIRNGYGISDGSGIENSYGIYNCKYIKGCTGLSFSIMCVKTNGKYKVFNKEIRKIRYDEINERIIELADDWYPKFTNAFDLKAANNNDWKCTPAPRIIGATAREAYKDMPIALIEYFKSLPEFDTEIFKEITGIEA